MNTATFKKPRKKSARKEQNEHLLFAKYLKLAYPALLFSADLSGVKLSMIEASLAKAMRANDFKVPDIVVYKPMNHIEGWRLNGLYIELKKSGQALRQVRKPELWKDEHVEKQAYSLARLNEQGYAAFFAVGFDAAKAIVDAYLDAKRSDNLVSMLSNTHTLTGLIYRPRLSQNKFPLFNHI